jgi:hypothetical protein
MSQYRFLQDASVGQFYYPAGTIASTADVGGTLPVGWVPGDVEPLDTAGVNAVYARGPLVPGLVRAQFSTQAVPTPATYWKGTPMAGATSWQLTGLGASLAPIFQ